MVRWRNNFSQLLNVHGFNDVSRETVEPVVPEPSAFEVELVTEKLKNKNQRGTDQIPAELIEAAGRTICSETQKLTNCIWNKEELPEEWKESVNVPIYQKGDKTD